MVKNNPKTYGTPDSEFLKCIISKGYNPIGITIMACEETFIFSTEEEAYRAHKELDTNEGWWYGLDGEYPWEETRKWYVDKSYNGIEEDAPKVYWLK